MNALARPFRSRPAVWKRLAALRASEASGQSQHILSATAGAHPALCDISPSEVRVVRIVPMSTRYKLNLDAGVLHAGGWVGNGASEALMGGKLTLNMRARVTFAFSYGL